MSKWVITPDEMIAVLDKRGRGEAIADLVRANEVARLTKASQPKVTKKKVATK